MGERYTLLATQSDSSSEMFNFLVRFAVMCEFVEALDGIVTPPMQNGC